MPFFPVVKEILGPFPMGIFSQFRDNHPIIKVTDGFIKNARHGFVYVVPSNTFRPGADEAELVSIDPAKPVKKFCVKPSDIPYPIMRIPEEELLDLRMAIKYGQKPAQTDPPDIVVGIWGK
jgi:hypothetical protein